MTSTSAKQIGRPKSARDACRQLLAGDSGERLTGSELAALAKEKWGMTIPANQASAYKSQLLGSRRQRQQSETVALSDITAVLRLAKEYGGLAAVKEKVCEVEALAARVGSFAKLTEVLTLVEQIEQAAGRPLVRTKTRV